MSQQPRKFPPWAFYLLAWTLVGPRYMPWIGMAFVLASLTCSVLGERATRRA